MSVLILKIAKKFKLLAGGFVPSPPPHISI